MFTIFHCVVTFAITVFHTKLITKMLNIKWHDNVSNSHHCKISKSTSWSNVVKKKTKAILVWPSSGTSRKSISNASFQGRRKHLKLGGGHDNSRAHFP